MHVLNIRERKRETWDPETGGRKPREERGRGWGDVATALEEARKHSEGARPC